MTNPSELNPEIWWKNQHNEFYKNEFSSSAKQVIVFDLAALRARKRKAERDYSTKPQNASAHFEVGAYYKGIIDFIDSLLPPNVPDEGKVE